jgi:5-methyltetrahydrofolate--homocysteine methyltransferase
LQKKTRMAEQMLQELYDSIVNGDRKSAKDRVQTALDSGLQPETILKESMIAAMTKVGEMFSCGEYYVPEMLIAAKAMQEALTVLKPHLVQTHVESAGKAVIGTVSGDLHDIGKNLVAMMLEGAGFEVVDLGNDVSPTKFVQAIGTNHPDIVGMSALLTTTMPSMKATLDAIRAEGLKDQVKVMIGGAPVTYEYAQKIGADGFAPDASRAVELAKSLVSAKRRA